jgi:hypothetical protein
MPTGDTHSGQVRVLREDTEGNRVVVAGPFSQDRVDYTNNDVNSEDKLFLNVSLTSRVGKPMQAEERRAPGANFASGERLIIQHKANTTVANDIDVSANTFAIDTLRQDQNRGRIYPDTLTQANQELSTDVEEDDSTFVDIFQETIPDRTEIRLAGAFEAVAVEN